jgi:hypothetical protein
LVLLYNEVFSDFYLERRHLLRSMMYDTERLRRIIIQQKRFWWLLELIEQSKWVLWRRQNEGPVFEMSIGFVEKGCKLIDYVSFLDERMVSSIKPVIHYIPLLIYLIYQFILSFYLDLGCFIHCLNQTELWTKQKFFFFLITNSWYLLVIYLSLLFLSLSQIFSSCNHHSYSLLIYCIFLFCFNNKIFYFRWWNNRIIVAKFLSWLYLPLKHRIPMK